MWLVINHFWFATDFSNFYSKFYRKINCLSELKSMEISLCFLHSNLFFSNFKLAPKRYEISELISLQILSDGHLGWNCYLGDSWINGIQGCQTASIFFIIVNLHFINWYQEFWFLNSVFYSKPVDLFNLVRCWKCCKLTFFLVIKIVFATGYFNISNFLGFIQFLMYNFKKD